MDFPNVFSILPKRKIQDCVVDLKGCKPGIHARRGFIVFLANG